MKAVVRIILLTLIAIATFSTAQAQWTPEWTAAALPTGVVSGWLAFQGSGSNWQYRFFTLDTTAFRVSDGALSSTVQYTYTFSAAERLAGELIYALGVDLTGDGITEFYVVSATGASSPYRLAVKVFDITTGAAVFERNLTNFSYSDATVWDANGDGTLDCVFTRSDYPTAATYTYEVFNTGVAASVSNRAEVPRKLDLRQNYPNPFNPSTRIDYDLRTSGRVELDITNVLGQRVRTLVDSHQSAGTYSIPWDGKDAKGSAQASGAYYYQIRVNGEPLEARQMILLK